MTAIAPPAHKERTKRQVLYPGDIVTFVIAFVLLLMPALSLRAAGWNLQMSILTPTIFASLLVGFLVSRSKYNELYALLMSTIYGACIIVLFGALAQPGGFAQGLYDLFARTLQWLIDAFSGGINQDDLIFTLIICGLFWFLGFNLAWYLFRVNRIWRAILPPGLILIINGVYYIGAANLEAYLIGFVFLSLILVARSNIEGRAELWRDLRVHMPANLRRYLYVVGAGLALFVLAAWLIPTSDIEDRLQNFQEFLASEPIQQLSEAWLRLFSSAETQGPATSDYYGGDSLQLGGAIRLGDEIALYVHAPPEHRYYWRSRVFDNYDMGRWTSAADTRLTDEYPPLSLQFSPQDVQGRTEVTQEFTIGLNASRLVYTAPQPLSVDLDTRTDMRYTPDEGMMVSVIRPAQILNHGDSYRATSLLSIATAEQLRAASTDYPQYILDLYPSYVPSATARTIQLAQQIQAEAGATTPYDTAKAIETWLRTHIVYDERISQPPQGQDPVDWLLFDIQRGYCNYYASAMIVMLRSLGIPARMAAGFAQGTYDPAQSAFIVRERDAHTWVEVYFPGYGWVEFEPTAAQLPLNRGDTPPVPIPPALQPTSTPSNTPTPVPSPTPPPTQEEPTITPTAEDEEASSENAAPPPTLTPSPTPSPTPEPAIVPTQPPPERPQRRDPFSFIADALQAGLLGLLVIVGLVLALFIVYWWWEWRGMRGLSAVSRAYARLERYVPLIGIHPRPQQTPEERRRTVVTKLPVIEPPVSAITTLYSSERYGPPRDEAEAKAVTDVANDAWADAREGIIGRFLRRLFMPWKRGKP